MINDLTNKLKECDDYHNRCDYLLDHSEITYLLGYIERLEKMAGIVKIKCKECGGIVKGDTRGTYISCECGKVAVDQTEYYVRIIGNAEDYEIVKE